MNDNLLQFILRLSNLTEEEMTAIIAHLGTCRRGELGSIPRRIAIIAELHIHRLNKGVNS